MRIFTVHDLNRIARSYNRNLSHMPVRIAMGELKNIGIVPPNTHESMVYHYETSFPLVSFAHNSSLILIATDK